MPISELPPAPSRSEEPEVFNSKGDALVAALPLFVDEANDLQADVNAKQAAAANSAQDAATSATQATAAAAAATFFADPYNSEATYAFPQLVVFTDGETYRARVNTVAGESPASVPSKWQIISAGLKADKTYVDTQFDLRPTTVAIAVALLAKLGNEVGVWQKSSEAYDRLLFISGSTSQSRGYGPTPHSWLNAAAEQIAYLTQDGRMVLAAYGISDNDVVLLGQARNMINDNVVKVAGLPHYTAGEDHYAPFCVRTSDQRLIGWGRGGGWGVPGGQEDVQMAASAWTFDPPIPNGVSIAGHLQICGTTTFAWLSNGWAYSSGRGDSGAQGQGDLTNRLHMKRVDYFYSNGILISRVYGNNGRLSNSYSYAYWLTSLGHVYFTGVSDRGAAGDGVTAARTLTTPVRCGTISGVVGMSVSGESYATVHAWREDGVCYAWGDQERGEAGIGSTAIQYSPQIVTGLGVAMVAGFKGANSVPAAYGGTLFLLKDGTVKFAGQGLYGQGGPNATAAGAAGVSTPVVVPGLIDIESVGISGGDFGYSWAVTTAKILYTWGHNAHGQLGLGSVSSSSPTPSLPIGYSTIAGGTVTTGNPPFQGKVKKVVAAKTSAGNVGAGAIYVLDTDGSVWVSGYEYILSVDPTSTASSYNRFSQCRVCQLPNGDKIVDLKVMGGNAQGTVTVFALTQQGRLLASGANTFGVATGGTPYTAQAYVRGFNLVNLPGMKM